jgi:PKD repeat protein
LTDSYWKTKEITKIINVIKNTKLKNNLSIYDDWNKIDPRYENNIYYIQDLLIPTTLKFDARSLKTDNPMDSLQKVTWELDSKTKIWNIFVFKMEYEWRATINAKYTFKNIKDSSIKEISDIIYINSIKKDALLDLEIKPSEEEYVPITIQFDASKSEIKDENITKFIFDYWDWTTPEEKDAVNKWHRYTIPWNYTIKLTAVTSSWKEYYLTKKLILKPRPQLIKINTSLKEAPIYQWIDFSSAGSEWQIISYFWDFWDNETSSDANPTHAYKESWTYKAKLKIEFENRNVLEDSVIIQVTE